MAREIKIYKMRDLVRKTESGQMDLARSIATVRELAALAAYHHDSNILVDLRQTQSAMDFSDQLTVISELAGYRNVFTNRLALIVPNTPERIQRATVFRAALDVQGFDMEFFVDYESAMEWLSDVTTYDLGPGE